MAIEEMEEAPHQTEQQALLDAHGGDPFALLRTTFSFLQSAHPAAFADSTAADKVLAALKGTSFSLSHLALGRSLPVASRRCRGLWIVACGSGLCCWAQAVDVAWRRFGDTESTGLVPTKASSGGMKGGFFSQASAAKPKAKPSLKPTAAAPTPTAAPTVTPAAATDEPPATTLPDAPEEQDDPNLQSEWPASLWSLPTLL